MLIAILAALYIISPIDLLPGPIDDSLVLIACIIYGIISASGSLSGHCISSKNQSSGTIETDYENNLNNSENDCNAEDDAYCYADENYYEESDEDDDCDDGGDYDDD